jgi:hypothetical protein
MSMDDDWLDEKREAPGKSKRFLDLTTTIRPEKVRQARTGNKTKRQYSQTIHLSDEIVEEVRSAVEKLAAEWVVPKNDVWQFVLLAGLQAIEDGERPDFRPVSRKVVLKNNSD